MEITRTSSGIKTFFKERNYLETLISILSIKSMLNYTFKNVLTILVISKQIKISLIINFFDNFGRLDRRVI